MFGFNRIITNPDVLGGKPIIKGTRISVEFILEQIASGGSISEIVKSYPHLAEEDVRQAVMFAADSVASDIFITEKTGVAEKAGVGAGA